MWRLGSALLLVTSLFGSGAKLDETPRTLDTGVGLAGQRLAAACRANCQSRSLATGRSRRPEHPLADARRVVKGRRLMLVPSSCGKKGSYDLVLHFHGATTTVEPIFRRSALDAVVVVTNLGLASGPYERKFSDRHAFERFVAAISGDLNELCRQARPGRIALSSWSAGYGATLRILGYAENSRRVDAVLLADGLHGGLERRFPRKVQGASLTPMSRFADQAARGQRLLAITHSEIKTPRYASTTETADYLLDSLGVARVGANQPGPRATMQLTSTAQSGSFWVAGYAGADTHAHCDHLYALGKTMLPRLEAWWANGTLRS